VMSRIPLAVSVCLVLLCGCAGPASPNVQVTREVTVVVLQTVIVPAIVIVQQTTVVTATPWPSAADTPTPAISSTRLPTNTLSPGDSATQQAQGVLEATASYVASRTIRGTIYLGQVSLQTGASGNNLYFDGSLTNVSGSAICFVKVSAGFADNDGNLVATETGYADQRCLGPGESSTFKITTENSGRIRSARVVKLDWQAQQ